MFAHPSPGRPITVKEAAEIKGVSTKSIRRYIAMGLLPAERVGPRLIRINSADLDLLGRKIGGAA